MQIVNMPIGSNINTSLQVGDAVYCSPVNTVGGFSTSTNNVNFVGIVTSINPVGSPNSINVMYDETNLQLALPTPGDYIMFGKNKAVNSSDVKGYYANIKFVNKRKDKVELFSIGSEVSQSSK